MKWKSFLSEAVPQLFWNTDAIRLQSKSQVLQVYFGCLHLKEIKEFIISSPIHSLHPGNYERQDIPLLAINALGEMTPELRICVTWSQMAAGRAADGHILARSKFSVEIRRRLLTWKQLGYPKKVGKTGSALRTELSEGLQGAVFATAQNELSDLEAHLQSYNSARISRHVYRT